MGFADRGYTAPEYAIHGQLSEKVDTYGYGVVLLEIISGRKSNDIKLEVENQYLLEWVFSHYIILLASSFINCKRLELVFACFHSFVVLLVICTKFSLFVPYCLNIAPLS